MSYDNRSKTFFEVNFESKNKSHLLILALFLGTDVHSN